MLLKHFYRALTYPKAFNPSQRLRLKLFSTTPLTSRYRSNFSTISCNMAEYKLKDLSSLDLKNGDKVEAEVEGIEGGKVLLVKLDDKVHAMNANCTHYGAPLKNGILTPEGRLTCPWHGGQLFDNQYIPELQLNTYSLLQRLEWRDRKCPGARSVDKI